MAMNGWKTIDTAPRDGTWIKARGYNFGDKTQGHHAVIAFFENEKWIEVGSEGSTLEYLFEWQPLGEQDRDSNG